MIFRARHSSAHRKTDKIFLSFTRIHARSGFILIKKFHSFIYIFSAFHLWSGTLTDVTRKHAKNCKLHQSLFYFLLHREKLGQRMIESVIFTSFRITCVAKARSFHTANSISIKYDKFDSAIINRITMCTSKFQHWRFMCIDIFQYCMQFLFLVQFSWVLISTLTWLCVCDFHQMKTKKTECFAHQFIYFDEITLFIDLQTQ